MSIDDDFFDVQDFVKDSPYEKPFNRINNYLQQLEIENGVLHKEVGILRKAMTVLESPMLDKVTRNGD